VLEAFGLVVDFPPLHAEEFREHALDQVMAEGELAGDFAAFGGEADLAAGFDADEAVFFQAAQSHGDRGRRDFQKVGEAGGDDGFAVGFRFEDRLEVVFFGNGDH